MFSAYSRRLLARYELIKALRTLREHDVTVCGTNTPEQLGRLLDSLMPVRSEKPAGDLPDREKVVEVFVGKGIEIRMTLAHLKGLSNFLEAPTPEDRAAVYALKREVADRGLDLYLITPTMVRVSPQVFYWFMNHPEGRWSLTVAGRCLASFPPFSQAMAWAVEVIHGKLSLPVTPGERLWKIAGGAVGRPGLIPPTDSRMQARDWNGFRGVMKRLSDLARPSFVDPGERVVLVGGRGYR